MVRKHIYFTGMVQGVGFRYRASYIAQSLGITGWVTNLYDGRVEMEVQGDIRAIQKLVSSLHEQRFIQIEKVEAEDRDVELEERRFHIR